MTKYGLLVALFLLCGVSAMGQDVAVADDLFAEVQNVSLSVEEMQSVEGDGGQARAVRREEGSRYDWREVAYYDTHNLTKQQRKTALNKAIDKAESLKNTNIFYVARLIIDNL